jgi:hypothetical protein
MKDYRDAVAQQSVQIDELLTPLLNGQISNEADRTRTLAAAKDKAKAIALAMMACGAPLDLRDVKSPDTHFILRQVINR